MFHSLISAGRLAAILTRPDLLVFDCRFDLANVERGEQSYRESHVPGAIYAHLDHHLSSPITAQSGRHPLPDIGQFRDWLGQSGFDGSQQVIAYDDSGCAMASRLWWLLRCMGHDRVACLDGGWQAWLAIDGEVEARIRPRQALQAPDLRLDDSRVATTAELLDNLQSQRLLVVDVRTGERFRGEHEPIDPVAGHLPGACNLPLMDNLDASGCYRPAAELRQLYAGVMAKTPLERQVYMCGSGVTACHSALALAAAGYAMPRVYAGSWSEWIRDPGRPVATGAA